MEETIKEIENSYMLHQNYQIRLENTTEKTTETMKHDIENKVVTHSPSNGAHSLIKEIQQKKKGADTKNSKLEGESPAMKANSDVPKERMGEGDGCMRNENGTLHTRTRIIKKPNRYDHCAMQI